MNDYAKPEVIAAISSAIAAAFSGLIAWRQHSWNKSHHLVSVRPLLADFLHMSLLTNEFEYTISNKGLGPAEILDYAVLWGDKKLKWNEAEEAIGGLLDTRFRIHYSELVKGYALSVSEQFIPITVTYTGCNNLIDSKETTDPQSVIYAALGELIKNFRIEIEYRSFLSDETQKFLTSPSESLLEQFK